MRSGAIGMVVASRTAAGGMRPVSDRHPSVVVQPMDGPIARAAACVAGPILPLVLTEPWRAPIVATGVGVELGETS